MTKAQVILQKIEDKVQDLTELNIQTLMGGFETDMDGNVKFKANQEVNGIISKVSLVDGDIITQMTEDFYKNYPELVQFHQSREAQGNEIIEGNVLALKTITLTLRELFRDNQ
jgi:hypothetical protein